jgi:hypothetical protein
MAKIPKGKYPKPCNFKIGKSFTSSHMDFIRFAQGENIQYALDIPTAYDGFELSTLGNLPTGFPKVTDQGTTYPSIHLGDCPPGHYHFKLKFKKGDETFVDNAGYSHIMVDPPHANNIRLYSLIPNITGTIDDWIVELERIADLGFNMVHMLPITKMDQSGSPYSAYSFFDVDPNYLKKGGATLKDFVAKAKKLKIGLCFDLVLNHVGFTSEMALQCPEWIKSDPDKSDGFKRAGCWAGNGWLTWEDLILLNYEHPNASIRQEIWEYMLEVVLYWGGIANETNGMIRLDNLHSTHHLFLEWVMDHLHQKYPNLVVLGELFASPEEQTKLVLQHQVHLLLATPWDKHYVADLRSQVEYIHKVYPQMKFILPISSHDSGTPTQEFYDVRSTIPRYAVSALLNCGSTGMCQGVEFGAPSKLEFIGFKGKQTIEGPISFHQEIKALNGLMEHYSCLRQGGNLSVIDRGHGAILGMYRYSLDSECPHMVVLINLDLHHEQSINLEVDGVSLFSTDQLQCIFGSAIGSSYELPINIKLAPCGVRVFKVLR